MAQRESGQPSPCAQGGGRSKRSCLMSQDELLCAAVALLRGNKSNNTSNNGSDTHSSNTSSSGVMALTGAGISVAAGLADFRGVHGLYRTAARPSFLPRSWKADDLFRRDRFADNPAPLTALLVSLADAVAAVACSPRRQELDRTQQQPHHQQQQGWSLEKQGQKQELEPAKRLETGNSLMMSVSDSASDIGSGASAVVEPTEMGTAQAQIQASASEISTGITAATGAAAEHVASAAPLTIKAAQADVVAVPIPLPDAHLLLEELHAQGLLVRWYTQNIDSLELKTVVPREAVAFLHGCLPTAPTPPQSSHSNAWSPALIAASVSFYGDGMKEADNLAADMERAHTLLVLGTSLAVDTAAAIAADFRGHRILVSQSVPGAPQVKLPPRRARGREAECAQDIYLDMDLAEFSRTALRHLKSG